MALNEADHLWSFEVYGRFGERLASRRGHRAVRYELASSAMAGEMYTIYAKDGTRMEPLYVPYGAVMLKRLNEWVA